MAVVRGANRPQAIHVPNGDPVTPMFSAHEMERRLSGLRSVMEELRVDATLFTSIHNINYFADFLYCSFGRKYGLVVTADGQTSISANIDGGQPYRRTFGENVVYTDWQRDNYFRAASGLLPGRAGSASSSTTSRSRAAPSSRRVSPASGSSTSARARWRCAWSSPPRRSP